MYDRELDQRLDAMHDRGVHCRAEGDEGRAVRITYAGLARHLGAPGPGATGKFGPDVTRLPLRPVAQLSSRSATARCPRARATSAAVWPSSVRAAGSASRSRNRATERASPREAARWSGV